MCDIYSGLHTLIWLAAQAIINQSWATNGTGNLLSILGSHFTQSTSELRLLM